MIKSTYKKTFFPDKLYHPWVSLNDFMESMWLSLKELSIRTWISKKHLIDIKKGKSQITPNTAIKFEKIFGMSASFWNNLELWYQESVSRIKEKELFEKNKKYLKNFPYSELAKNWYVDSTSKINEKIDNLLKFFEVSSLEIVNEIYQPDVIYRKTESSNLKVNQESLISWLKCGEKKVESKELWEYKKQNLKKILPELKELTKLDYIDIEKIEELLSKSWVHFAFVPMFKNVPVNWVSRSYKWNPFIQLSDRNKKLDIFWFSLFHEIAHILNDLSKKDDIFINFEEKEQEIEQKANQWASDFLIERKDYELYKEWKINIQELIQKSNVGEHIITGRLAFDMDQKGNKEIWSKVAPYRKPLKLINNK